MHTGHQMLALALKGNKTIPFKQTKLGGPSVSICRGAPRDWGPKIGDSIPGGGPIHSELGT